MIRQLKYIQKKINMTLGRVPVAVWYVLLGILTLFSYVYGWRILTAIGFQTTIYQITVVFLIFLYMIGVALDKYTKKMSKRKGWVVYLVGLVLVILVFKYIGGMETIF